MTDRNKLAGDEFDTRDVLARMLAQPAESPWPVRALRGAASYIPVDDRESAQRGADEPWMNWWARTSADSGGASALAAMLKGGLGTAANWLDWGNKTRPEDYSGGDTLAPLGMVAVGMPLTRSAVHPTPRSPREWAPEFVGPHRADDPWSRNPAPAPREMSALDQAIARAEETSAQRNVDLLADPSRASLPLVNSLAEQARPAISHLPMDEASRMARAKELGFDTSRTFYHGTPEATPFESFDLGRVGSNMKNEGIFGKGVYLTENKAHAHDYANEATLGAPRGHIREVYVRAEKPYIWGESEAPLSHSIGKRTDELKTQGYDSVHVPSRTKAGQAEEFVVFDPKNIRDVNAAFDPAMRDSASLLAADSSRASLPGTLVNALSEQARGERPISAATKYGDRVFAAPVHGMEYKAAIEAMGKAQVEQLLNTDAAIRGFVTNRGRFLTREEAAEMAAAADPGYKPRFGKGADSSNFITDKDLAALDPSLRKVIEEQRAAWPNSVFKGGARADNELGSVPGTLVNALSEQGKPIRAYHGMAGQLEGGKFDPARFGQHHPDDRSGVFLTTNPETAGGWADWASSRSPREAIGDNAAIVPADAHFKNPLEVQSRNYDPSQHWYDNKDDLLATAQRGGHDGIIIRQPNTGEATLVALQPGTVKSALTGKALYGLAPALMGPALVNALSGEHSD